MIIIHLISHIKKNITSYKPFVLTYETLAGGISHTDGIIATLKKTLPAMAITAKSPEFTLDQQIHEEEVRYNEAIRMNAGFVVLEAIRLKIVELKAELRNFDLIESSHPTLRALYAIVKAEKEPVTYLCTPHQIILRQTEEWPIILTHLEVLANHKLITIKQLDKLYISITTEGIAKAKALDNGYVNNNFSFSRSYKNGQQSSASH